MTVKTVWDENLGDLTDAVSWSHDSKLAVAGDDLLALYERTGRGFGRPWSWGRRGLEELTGMSEDHKLRRVLLLDEMILAVGYAGDYPLLLAVSLDGNPLYTYTKDWASRPLGVEVY